MNDHDLDARLRAKYRARSTDAAPPTLARRVLAIPADSPQRRGWLPRLPQGGTRRMLSPSKAFVALAIIASSAAILVGQTVSEPADVSTPATSIHIDHSPAYVDGTVEILDEPDFEPSALGSGYFEWTAPPATLLFETDDERINGQATAVEHGLQHFKSWNGVRTILWTIENDGGSWSGVGNEFSRVDGGEGFVVFTGHGGYEGLSAYLSIGHHARESESDASSVRGVVFPAGPPSRPEAPSAE